MGENIYERNARGNGGINLKDLKDQVDNLVPGDGSVDLSDYYTKEQTNDLLDLKQDLGSYATSAQLTSGLAGKANTIHTHSVSDVTGLQAALDSKQDVGSGGIVSATAARYGCKLLTFPPDSVSDSGTKSVALTQNRLYAFWLPCDVGTVITGFRYPMEALAAGSGAITFAVYQHDLTQAGTTADLNSALTTGSAQTWRNSPLQTPVTTTGQGFWIVLLSTVSQGPALMVSDPAGLPGWISNPSNQKTALYLNDVTGGLPTPLAPDSMNLYQDLMIGIY